MDALTELWAELKAARERIYQLERQVMITNGLSKAEQRLGALADRIKSRYSTWLPFKGYYVDALIEFLQRNLHTIEASLTAAFTGGNVTYAVNFMIDMARGNLILKWPWSMFASSFLEGLRWWLVKNPDVFRDVIAAPPEQSNG